MSPIRTYRRYLDAVLPALAVVLIGFFDTSITIFPIVQSVSDNTELLQEPTALVDCSIAQFEKVDLEPFKTTSSTTKPRRHFDETIKNFRNAVKVKLRLLKTRQNTFTAKSYLLALLRVSNDSVDPYPSYCLS